MFHKPNLPKYHSRETPIEHRLKLDQKEPDYDLKTVPPAEKEMFVLAKDDAIIADYRRKGTITYELEGATEIKVVHIISVEPLEHELME